ncbi:phosphatidylinositol-glycan biosynthesis class X protein [Drosophila subobscura]|uniref:phosphatidylinositol-glycan biosynthesis class X protein n=1 Tax=Drosophila subobscura TaxID=7241 RepID=UPI00155AA1B5|nr:phosphatidylinositol-glycan biosynthesis class X protein [Drosophila subobscura]
MISKRNWRTTICVLTLLASAARSYLLQQPVVHVEMEKAGMHRTLTYRVQFDYPLAGKDCDYMLLQPLPAAVYISTDELDDLQRLKRLSAVYPKFVNIEEATERAQPFSVLLRGVPKLMEVVTLPIHFRYHAPSDKRSTSVVAIATPELYLNCPIADNELVDNELVARPDKLYCLNAHKSRFDENIVTDREPTTIHNLERCNWKQIHVDYQLRAPLRAEIPVGNTNAYAPVLYGTIILTWTMAIWTMLRTLSSSRRINQRLNEQRQLQRKVK